MFIYTVCMLWWIQDVRTFVWKHFYMYKHIDLFAIPDFSAGAMENWGLITYRETAILYDPESTSSHGKQVVATIVSHELAHQVIVVFVLL